MTKAELLALLRAADETTCYEAMLKALQFRFPDFDRGYAACVEVLIIARVADEPSLLMGLALKMIPEGCTWAYTDRAYVYEPSEAEDDGWQEVSESEHPIPAIALTIANLEAMP